MNKKSFSQFKNTITFGLGVALITISGISYSQTYTSNNETIFRDSKGNLYVNNNNNQLTPIYPVEENISLPYTVQTNPSYYNNNNYIYQTPVYNTPYRNHVYQEPMYTSSVVADIAPWILIGGAAIAISNHNSHRYDKYDRPPIYHGRYPTYNGHNNRDYRYNRGHRNRR